MTSGRHDHGVPVRRGDVHGRLTVECEIASHPHYGKRARYRCACGARVERVCTHVRHAERRARELRARTGRAQFGPCCGAACPFRGRPATTRVPAGDVRTPE
jgi:hypothetical protein